MSPRLFLKVVSLEARTKLSYRVEFWLAAVASFAADFGVVWFVWMAMFRESGAATIGGWTREGIVLYYLTVVLVGKLVRFREFGGNVSHDIYQGGLNKYLVFPVGYLPYKLAQRVGVQTPRLLQFGLLGVIAVLVLDLPADAAPTAASALMAAAAVAMAFLLNFLMDACIHQVAFWADNVWSLDVAKWFITSMLGGFMLPLSVFPEWARTAMEWLPFRLLFDVPARVLLQRADAAEWAGALASGVFWCAVFAVVARVLWRRGSLEYTGVGI